MKIAYVVDRFPILSQTFVINEIQDHLSNNLDVDILVLEGERYADFPSSQLPRVFHGRVQYLGIEHSIPRNLRRILRPSHRVWSVLKALSSAVADMRKFKHDSHLRTLALTAEVARMGDRYDIIHTHFGHVAARVAKARSFTDSRAATVATIHAFEIARRTAETEGLISALIEHTNLILSVNSLWKEQLLECGATEEQVIVHHMGVDLGKLKPITKKEAERILKLVTTGRMVEKKGHLFLVQALSKMKLARPDIEFEAIFIGTGPLENKISDEIARLGLDNNIQMRGALPHSETLDIVANSDVFVLPSVTAADGDMEGIPVALMEAMALSVPVISTFHSGIPDLIQNGESGLLVPERDTDCLASTLIDICTDDNLRRELSNSARVSVGQHFNAQKLGKELREIYKALLE